MWAFKRTTDEGVLDSDEFNENMVALAQEGSNLTEANFAAGQFVTMYGADRVKDDFAVKAWRISFENSPLLLVGASLSGSERWEEVSGSRKTIETSGGPVVAIASWQFSNVQSGKDDASVLHWCIMVDSAPRLESLIGTGDGGNDVHDFPAARLGTPYFPTHLGTAPGTKAYHKGLSTEMVAFLAPGRHTFALGARNLRTKSTDATQVVTQCELILLELWA